MNKIKIFMKELTDEELRMCVIELGMLELKGVLEEGKIREIAKRLENVSGGIFFSLDSTIHVITREIADRWYGQTVVN